MYAVHDLAWDGRQYQPRDFASRLRSSKYLLCNSKHSRWDHQIMYTAAEEMTAHFINMRFILFYNISKFPRENLRFQSLSQRECEWSTNPDPFNMFWGLVKIRRCIYRPNYRKIWLDRTYSLATENGTERSWTDQKSRKFKQITSLS